MWEKLVECGVPCVRTKPTLHVILDTYNKLYLKYIRQWNIQQDLVFIAVHMDFLSHYDVHRGSDYEQLISRLDVTKQLNSFASDKRCAYCGW